MEKTLLLIEDNPMLIGLYKAAFEEQNVTVLTAHDGKTGVELTKIKKPNVVLTDFLMIGINGFDVLEALKADPETKDIKVIMLTIVSEQENKDKAKKLGAADYLVKSDLKVSEIVKKVMAYF